MKGIKEIREIAAKYDIRPQELSPVVVDRDGDIVYVAMQASDFQAVEEWLNRQYEQKQRALLMPEIKAYQKMLPELLTTHKGKWVAVYHGQLIDSDDDDKRLWERTRQVHPRQVIYYVCVEEQHPAVSDMDSPEGDSDFVSL